MSPPRPRKPSRAGLVRAIGRWDLTAAVINGVIGSSIFGMPADAGRAHRRLEPAGLRCWPGSACCTIVLCFAEVASRFRSAGGPYLYAREAFGRARRASRPGWLTFWIRVTSMAANLNVFVDYLAPARCPRRARRAGARWP